MALIISKGVEIRSMDASNGQKTSYASDQLLVEWKSPPLQNSIYTVYIIYGRRPSKDPTWGF